MKNIINVTNLKNYKNQNIKVGIIGGSFDPAHDGHVHIAQNAKIKLNLDEVWFAVSPQNPWKPPHKYAYLDRIHKLNKLICGIDGFKILTIEKDIGKVYTADLFLFLRQHLQNITFTFIAGADIAGHLPQWEKINDLLSITNIAIFSRGGYNVSQDTLDKLAKYGKKIIFVKIDELEISSTAIRKQER